MIEITLALFCGFFAGMIAMFFLIAAIQGIAEADREIKAEQETSFSAMAHEVRDFEDKVAETRNRILK